MGRIISILADILTLVVVALMALALVLLAGCQYAGAPAPALEGGETLVVVVGGWRADRTWMIGGAIAGRCPRARVVSAGEWNAYQADVAAIVAANPRPKLVLIGHSFGAEACVHACIRMRRRVEYLVLLDPVNTNLVGDLPAPPNAGIIELFCRAYWFGPRVARVAGVRPITVQGGHSYITEDRATIDRIVMTINRL